MKNIIPALNKVQLSCMEVGSTSNQKLGQARRELFAAIREALVEVATASAQDVANAAMGNTKQKLFDQYLAKFDKLNNTD